MPVLSARVNVSSVDIDNYFYNLFDAVHRVPVSLVFNIDEAGEDEYVDTNAYQVIVDSTYPADVVGIPNRRESKRSTLIHCISADGTYTKPLLIIPRKTVDSSILKRLCCNNVLIKHQEKGFANTELIKYWLETIFFPEVERKLNEEFQCSSYSGHAVLILDGFSCRMINFG